VVPSYRLKFFSRQRKRRPSKQKNWQPSARLKISGVGGGVVAAAKVVGALKESRLGKKA
jgi:hypothetical protein